MIYIEKDILENIYRHVRESYPNECCGILAGNLSPKKEILAAYPADNINTENARDHYEIDPAQFNKIDDEIRNKGLSITGIYHSHPDHPCAPSNVDTERAWEEYSYIIIAINNSGEIKTSSWILNGNGRFVEEEIIIK